MGKKIFLLFILCLQIITLCAQTGADAKVFSWGKVELGIEGGPNSSGFFHIPNSSGGISDSYFDLGYASFSAGMTALYHISSDFSIKTGLAYEGKGNTESTGTYYEAATTHEFVKYTSIQVTRMNYISIYALARYGFGRKNRFFLEGGPYLAYLINNSIKTSYVDSWGRPAISVFRDDYPPIDAGLIMDFGYGLPIGKRLVAELAGRLDIGLTSLEDVSLTGESSFNQSAILLLALRYRL